MGGSRAPSTARRSNIAVTRPLVDYQPAGVCCPLIPRSLPNRASTGQAMPVRCMIATQSIPALLPCCPLPAARCPAACRLSPAAPALLPRRLPPCCPAACCCLLPVALLLRSTLATRTVAPYKPRNRDPHTFPTCHGAKTSGGPVSVSSVRGPFGARVAIARETGPCACGRERGRATSRRHASRSDRMRQTVVTSRYRWGAPPNIVGGNCYKSTLLSQGEILPCWRESRLP